MTEQRKTVIMNANETMYLYHYGIVTRIVDGDGFFLADLITGKELEIRLLGIDAPEISNCKKLLQDERETHLPGDLLKKLGLLSKIKLAALLPIGTKISYRCNNKNNIDVYGRTLAYVFLLDNTCINEKMIREGYAKPLKKYYCDALAEYQQLFFAAKAQGKGLFEIMPMF